jgi:lysophospholipid acyltransferase (LPLAT)-like uncharacterized protein
VPSHSTKAYSLDRRILLAIVPPLAALFIRVLAVTLRYKDVCEEGAAPAAPDTRDIWCFWHRCLLASACRFKGRHRATLLISSSFDGELIARTIHRIGFLTARGSSSRGGTIGLRELARAVESGSPAVFPADGPRGPRYQLKPGAIKLAQLTGRPACPFYVHPQSAWKLRSWDEFLIPRPFSRVAIGWSRPVFVGNDLDAAAFEQARLTVEAGCERARRLAEQYFL